MLFSAVVVACPHRPAPVAEAPGPAGRVSYYLCRSHQVEARTVASEAWTGCEVDQGPVITGDAVLRYPDVMAAAGIRRLGHWQS